MLLFADDLKLFHINKSPNDVVLLQNDLNVLSDWCSKNNLLLNVFKYKVLTFSKKREKYLYDSYITLYLLYESELTRVYKNDDLGIIFDESLTFNEHYLCIQNKASSMLGFINRSCKSFNNPYALKALYYSYVRSILDYASMVWSPSRIGPIHAIESIQNRFLRFLSFKCDIQRQLHSSYLPLLTVLNMESLEIRRKRLDLCFIDTVNYYMFINTPCSRLYLNIEAKLCTYICDWHSVCWKKYQLFCPFYHSTNQIKT